MILIFNRYIVREVRKGSMQTEFDSLIKVKIDAENLHLFYFLS